VRQVSFLLEYHPECQINRPVTHLLIPLYTSSQQRKNTSTGTLFV